MLFFTALLRIPGVKVGVVAAALLAVMGVGFKVAIGRERDAREAAELRAERAEKETQIEINARRLVENDNTGLRGTIRQQSADVQRYADQIKTAQADATVIALRRLELGRTEAGLLRQPTTNVPPGHEPMNAWLVERLGGQ